MARDFEPPVRERDAVPARRAARREAQPPDEPELALGDPEQAYPASRVARDEHRPRRGTLPDRRLLRRDPLPDADAPIRLGPPDEAQEGDSDSAASALELDAPDRERSSYDALRASAPRETEATPARHEPAAAPSPGREPRGAAATSGGDPQALGETPGLDARTTAAASGREPRAGAESSVRERAENTSRPGDLAAAAPSDSAGPQASAVVGDSAVSTEGLSVSEQTERECAPRVVTEGARPRDSDRVEGERMDGEGTRGVDAVDQIVPPALESGGPEPDRIAERPEAEATPRRRRGAEAPRGELGEPQPGHEIARVGEPTARKHHGEREGRHSTDIEGRGRGADAPGRERRRAPGGEGQRGEGRHAPRADGREPQRAPGREPRRADGPDPQRSAGAEAPRGEGAPRAEGREAQRPRPTDADRVHLGGRTGTPGRPRRPRPEGEAADRPERSRQARSRPERPATEEQKRTAARKTKSDKAAQSKAAKTAAAKRRAAAKKKQSGPKLLDDAARAKLEVVAREQNGLRAAWATFRLHTDDLRRRNFAARAERMEYGSVDEFDRTTAQLTDRGYIGAGGGRMNVIGRPVEYRATTAQVAGLWPWSVGAGAPLIGTPLGSHLHTGAPVCFDPMNWFMRGSFITAPSLFVLGLNGFGKSSLVRRIVLGGVAQGITPLILADVKPDYRKLVELVDGQVIDLGYGHGKLNPLAAGVLGSIVPMLDDLPELQVQVMQELRARQTTLVAGLVELVRGARVRDYEETLLSTALRILYRTGSEFSPDKPPIIEDLLTVIVAGGDEMQLDAGADNAEEYQNAIKGLRRSLRALTQGPFGAVFNGQTTTPIDTTATAVCIDVSHIPSGDKKLKAAVMLACWADGFASVEAAHVLADADLGPQRYFQVVMDELWQVLGLGDFMVDRVDELTRLQRGIATSLIMISHTIKDLQSLGSEAAISKALGFLERARAKIFGALPAEEIQRLDSTVPFTSAEEDMVTSWSAPQALTGEALKPGQHRPPAPGTGKFLLKIGEDRRPGIPFQMEFTPSEKESGIHDTNQRFSEFTESTARRGTDDGSAA
ncbi:MAG: hypothetical protein JWN03_2653 [Nocardia sp.]|uniref:hypothetical protein n=1 Tax=Nocardia sp. TaxID=1821 RepID=UPI0026035C66|nr:hypothetical protein [Nocardia sp.]MCU1642378.1 hypothetical protein [Nocardia sp.]